MTKKEMWLKLLGENDIALTSAIILIERYVTEEQLKSGSEYIQLRKQELNDEVSEDVIKSIFPNFAANHKSLHEDNDMKDLSEISYGEHSCSKCKIELNNQKHVAIEAIEEFANKLCEGALPFGPLEKKIVSTSMIRALAEDFKENMNP